MKKIALSTRIAWIFGVVFFLTWFVFPPLHFIIFFFFSIIFPSFTNTRNNLFRSDLFCCYFKKNAQNYNWFKRWAATITIQCKLSEIKKQLQNKPRLRMENNVINIGRYRVRAGAFGVYFPLFRSFNSSICCFRVYFYSFRLFLFNWSIWFFRSMRFKSFKLYFFA